MMILKTNASCMRAVKDGAAALLQLVLCGRRKVFYVVPQCDGGGIINEKI